MAGTLLAGNVMESVVAGVIREHGAVPDTVSAGLRLVNALLSSGHGGRALEDLARVNVKLQTVIPSVLASIPAGMDNVPLQALGFRFLCLCLGLVLKDAAAERTRGTVAL
jgi:hypothetical protein